MNPAIKLILLFVFTCSAKAYKTDSLSVILKKGTTKENIDFLCNLQFDILTANNQQALPVLLQYADSARQMKASRQLSRLYGQISLAYYYNGKYDKNLEYGLKAIHLYDSLHNYSELGTMYGELGYQMKRSDISQAFYYMHTGIRILEKLNEPEPLAKIYDNYGVLFEMTGSNDSALFFYKKALSIKRKLNDSLGIPYSLNNIFQVYMLTGDIDSAYLYLNRSTKIREQIRDEIGLAENYSYFGEYYLRQVNYHEAVRYYTMTYRKALDLNYLYLAGEACSQLSLCQEKLHNYPEALRYYRLYKQYHDSLVNEETNNTIARLKVQFDTDRKEKEIELLTRSKEIQNLELRSRSMQLIILIITLILAVVLFIFLYTRFRQRQRQILQQKLLEEKKLRIKSIINAQDKERGRIARDLHDGVGQLLSAAAMRFSKLEDQPAENPEFLSEQKKIGTALKEACDEVRSISHRIMPRALNNSGLVPAVNDLLQSSFEKNGVTYSFDTFGFNERLGEETEIGIYRICQELISNILKHAGCSKVFVQLYKNKNYIILTVEDNGKGIQPGKDTGGMGLKNIASRAESLGGIFSVENVPDAGMLAKVRIPVL